MAERGSIAQITKRGCGPTDLRNTGGGVMSEYIYT